MSPVADEANGADSAGAKSAEGSGGCENAEGVAAFHCRLFFLVRLEVVTGDPACNSRVASAACDRTDRTDTSEPDRRRPERFLALRLHDRLRVLDHHDRRFHVHRIGLEDRDLLLRCANEFPVGIDVGAEDRRHWDDGVILLLLVLRGHLFDQAVDRDHAWIVPKRCDEREGELRPFVGRKHDGVVLTRPVFGRHPEA